MFLAHMRLELQTSCLLRLRKPFHRVVPDQHKSSLRLFHRYPTQAVPSTNQAGDALYAKLLHARRSYREETGRLYSTRPQVGRTGVSARWG